MKSAENVHTTNTANTAKRNVAHDKAPKPAEMVYLDGRTLRPPEGHEHYVDSEDENLGAMMLANKTENAAAHTANTAERKIAQDKTLEAS